MAGLVAPNPREAFRIFKNHIGELLNATITHCPVRLDHRDSNHPHASIHFPKFCLAPLNGSRFKLYLAQTLRVEQQGPKEWLLKTTKYTYRIERDAPVQVCYFRFEYEEKVRPHPRHHLHLPGLHSVDGVLDLEQVHVPTGWVLIEEVIRFLITELNVKSADEDWEDRLFKSEKLFREWTGRVPPRK